MKLRSILRSIPILKRIYPSLFLKFSYLLNKNIFLSKFKNVYLKLDIRDPIDRSILLFDFYEDKQIKYLCKIFKENKINYFFDVGANCGIYSLIISKLFPKTSFSVWLNCILQLLLITAFNRSFILLLVSIKLVLSTKSFVKPHFSIS